MGDDWAAVAALAIVLDVDADSLLYVIKRSQKDGVSAEVVLEGYRRTIQYWSTNDDSTFGDFEALAPGELDLRVLDQPLL